MRSSASPYGFHRVKGNQGLLPQAAEQLDASLPLYANEILIELAILNLDSTSFKQISDAAGGDVRKIESEILQIVRLKGKMHNPVTQSGGMLIGEVREVGEDYRGNVPVKVGDKIATLVSLTLTPLELKSIEAIDLKTGQIQAKGHAILFESGIAAILPKDIPEKICLALLDVCGAPALSLRYAKPGQQVLFVGAGKSAKLSAAALRMKFDSQVLIHAVDVSEENLREMKEMDLADEVFKVDARKADWKNLQDQYDLVINVANVPGTEMFSILAVKQRGRVLFFSMATEFSKVALGAEGIGKDAEFLIGNGYAQGHADLALEIFRKNKKLRKYFEEKYP